MTTLALFIIVLCGCVTCFLVGYTVGHSEGINYATKKMEEANKEQGVE